MAIDDAFAQRFGLDDLEALRGAVREQMQGEFAEAARAKTKRSLLDALAERHSFDVPPGMVEEEYRGIVHQVVAHSGDGAQAQGQAEAHDHDHDHDHDHEHHDHSGHPSEDEKISEEDRAEYRQIAERRVRLGLLLSEVGRMNNIQVTDEEVTNAIRSQAARFPGQEKFVFEYYQKNPQALAQVRAPLFEDKVVDFILEMAQVSEKEVTPEQLFADDEDEAAEAAAETKAAPKKKASGSKAKAAAKPKKAKAKAEAKDGDETEGATE